jgi:PQQ-dependent dehydrogenase (s-GDH family)
LVLATLIAACATAPVASASAPRFSSRVVTTGLGDPFEIVWGPDGFIWATDKGGRILHVDPASGAQTTLASFPDAPHAPGAQDGVLGLALHPGLLKATGEDYVFVSHTYDIDPGEPVERRTKIIRLTYRDGKLGQPVDLLTGLVGGVDHQSGRLKIGPDGRLYYTIGDQGANQFDAMCEPIRAQQLPTEAQVRAKDWSAYRGKVLRLNLDGSIPGDNPVLNGVRSHIYTVGHRNPQGLAFGPTGILYSSEQGPKTDDEVNILRKGGNYGWPHVAGYRDNKAYIYGNWSASANPPCAELAFDDYVIPPSVPQTRETDWYSPDFVSPVRTFHTVSNGHNFKDPKCAEDEQWYMCWPTIAPSSVDVTTLPGWGTSLLVPSLKEGTVYRLGLSADGRTVTSTEPLWRTVNRYRDTAISPDGRSFFVATDSGGRTKDADGKPTDELTNPGAILEFRLTS